MAQVGQVKEVRTLIIFTLLAIVCLGVAACPKGHKNYGGSSGSAVSNRGGGSGLFGGGAPPGAPGYYYNVGNGWQTFSSETDTISGDTVKYSWRFTPTEQQQVSFIAACVSIRMAQVEPDRTYMAIRECSPIDKSKYPDYMMIEFSITEPGVYKLSDMVHMVVLSK